jgi:hypothetical protein
MKPITLETLEDAYWGGSLGGCGIRDGIKAVIEKLISDAPDEKVLVRIFSEYKNNRDGLLAVRNYILGDATVNVPPSNYKDDAVLWRQENANLHKQLREQQDELRRLNSIVYGD